MSKMVIGLLAHVDAGKTTTIEGMLATSGQIKRAGRVDRGESLLDYDPSERSHGITITDKESWLTWQGHEIYLIDTPGHVDFSAEMERALPILDMAIVILNAQDGFQSHTETILKCLQDYGVPTMIFVNKMDIRHYEKDQLLRQIEKQITAVCADPLDPFDQEKIALASDALLQQFENDQAYDIELVRDAVKNRQLFPIYFGSAFQAEDIANLLDRIVAYSPTVEDRGELAAKVYQVTYDHNGNRLTHVKITGGVLKAKQVIDDTHKVDLIYRANGPQLESIPEADVGMVCLVKGLLDYVPGDGIGVERGEAESLLTAAMIYEMFPKDSAQFSKLLPFVQRLKSEDPALQIKILSDQRIKIHLMGEIQKEIITERILREVGVEVEFSAGSVRLAETIRKPVYGIGHYEPLRHYAEVLLRLEPSFRGSGIRIISECPTDVLGLSYQKAIIGALQGSELIGVLTGSPFTDMRIVLVSGRAHPKHTEGGDFREAALRAVRMGLMMADNVLLEPLAQFRIRVENQLVSRVLYDLEQRHATVSVESDGEQTMIIGTGPIRLLSDYEREIRSISHGNSSMWMQNAGWIESPDSEELIAQSGYEPLSDLSHPADSIFCSHGGAELVDYRDVERRMHLTLPEEKKSSGYRHETTSVSMKDLDRILEQATGRNKNPNKEMARQKRNEENVRVKAKPTVNLPHCLIVDGYNMIYDWQSLRRDADENFSVAREELIEQLFAYQGWTKSRLILVFDGYRREDNYQTTQKRGDMEIIYTRRNVTADQYIQELAYKLKGKYRITVASSDQLIQTAIFSQGAMRMSARELEDQVRSYNTKLL